MEVFDSTTVIQGDDQCRDGHYRAKEDLLKMVVSENGAKQELDPNATISLQAQNPTELGDLRVGSASEEAAGTPAIFNTMLYGIGDMGVMRAPEAFLKINMSTDSIARAARGRVLTRAGKFLSSVRTARRRYRTSRRGSGSRRSSSRGIR